MDTSFISAALIIAGIGGVLAALIVVVDSLVNNYGTLKLNINKGQKELEIKGGAPLLMTLSEQEIFIPSACGGRGSCGACKAQLIPLGQFSGNIALSPTTTRTFSSRGTSNAGSVTLTAGSHSRGITLNVIGRAYM